MVHLLWDNHSALFIVQHANGMIVQKTLSEVETSRLQIGGSQKNKLGVFRLETGETFVKAKPKVGYDSKSRRFYFLTRWSQPRKRVNR